MPSSHIACDLGAESCRVILGYLEGRDLQIREIRRFPNGPVTVSGTMRWDVLHIFDELKAGLREVAAIHHQIDSISTDSWGVDYVYITKEEPLLTLPYHYRDHRTENALEKALAVVPPEVIFSETGTQFIQFNTLYQLLDDLRRRPEIVRSSEGFLNIGDYFNYLFSGEQVG